MRDLQAAEGQPPGGVYSARQARLLDKDSPDARLQFAIESSRSAFPEYRNQSWTELWALCHLPPPVGIAAARPILRDARLTAEAAKPLLPTVQGHPNAYPGLRPDIVSALILFFPAHKDQLIPPEVQTL